MRVLSQAHPDTDSHHMVVCYDSAERLSVCLSSPVVTADRFYEPDQAQAQALIQFPAKLSPWVRLQNPLNPFLYPCILTAAC